MIVQTRRRPSRPPTFSFGLAAFAASLVFAAGAHAGPQPAPAEAAAAQAPVQATLAPELARKLAGGGKADFLVTLHEKADLSPAFAMDWTARGRYVHRVLKETAERSQGPLRRALEARGARVESNWVTNTLVVHDGNLAVAEAARRSARVARVEPLPVVRTIEPEYTKSADTTRSADGITPNIRQIRAPLAWADGTTGAGVTVGVIDHAPFIGHEAIRHQFRGSRADGSVDYDYNWFHPEGALPSAQVAHGTHVTGLMVGDNQAADPAKRERVGVAPGAQWIACQGFTENLGSTESLLRCAEFMLAPTKQDGTGANPDLRPAVVNNSWQSFDCSGGGESAFRGAIDAWVAAGIVPVFAQGNTQGCGMTQPPGLQSVPAPASLASVFAVGSSGNHDGLYAPHSTWGPTSDLSADPHLPDTRGYPNLKPQLIAPGVTVRSSIDVEGMYQSATGTSMSAPQVAGTIALMLDAGPCLLGDYARIGTLLMQTARGVPYDTGGTPPPGPGNVPNYAAGWGELDVYAAVNAAAAACGAQGFIRGHVRDGAGSPVAGAVVEIFDNAATPLYRLVTGADGGYTRRLPERAGSGYRVHTWAYGYIADDETGLVVANGADTLHDVTLARAPATTLSGTVRDASTGWPLHARIAIDGYPGGGVWSDPVTGAWSVLLPTGTRFRLDVTAELPGYVPQSRELAEASGADGTFALAADLVQCAAPGYAFRTQVLSQDFESNGNALPAGWTRSSAGIGWLFGDTATVSHPFNPIVAHGRFAASVDMNGPDFGIANDGRYDYLVLPPLNLAAAASPVLRFASTWPQADGRSRAVVEGSRDGGATWQVLGHPQNTSENEGRWSRDVISLAPLAGSSDARVRFHADDGSTDDEANTGATWAIDDAEVVAGCAPPAGGGLVTGHVRDANDAAPLDGAQVRIGSGAVVTTATSADPAIGGGYYTTWAPAGTAVAAAGRGTNPAGYVDGQANVTVVNGRVAVADITLGAARLRLYPSAGPAASLPLGTTKTVQLTARNHGGVPLAFALQQAQIEEHFDDRKAAFPPPGWAKAGDGDCGWDILAENWPNYAGGDTWAAVADGAPCLAESTPYDVSLVTPSIDLSASQSAAVGFFISFGLGTGTPRLDVDVSTDGGATWHTEWSVASNLDDQGPGKLVERDLSAYAGAHDMRVRFRMTAPTPAGRVLIDQVHLFTSASSSPYADFAPDGATLAAGATRDIAVTFDARGVPQPGTYAVALRIAQDTPYAFGYGDVQATMNVTAPAGWGALAGVVNSLGACDAHPEPLAGAQVDISNAQGGTYRTTTGADGRYRYWRPASEGPFRITVNATSHEAKTVTGIALTAGAETAADVGLRPSLSCVATSPAALSADLPEGQGTGQKAFDLVNLGPAPGAWTLRVGGDPTVRIPKLVTQTESPVPSDLWKIGCSVFEYDVTLTNTYLRVFPLEDSDDPSDYLTVSGIEFGITEAHSPEGTQPAFARLYALHGELRNENLQLLREQAVQVPDATLTRQRVRFDAPLVVPRHTVIVAAIHVPTGTGLGRALYMGTNDRDESAPGYWMSPDCDGLDQPVPTREVQDGFSMLLDLEVQTSDACSFTATRVPWLGVSPASGQLAGDGGATAQATFNASGLTDGAHQGSLCLESPARSTPLLVPVTLRVGAGDLIFRDGFER